ETIRIRMKRSLKYQTRQFGKTLPGSPMLRSCSRQTQNCYKSRGAMRPIILDEDTLFGTLEKLRKIVNNHVGVIELAEDLDIETVTEIFIRVNSAGAELSQADFAMSKIAANETYGGNLLRKAIDYFCHLAVAPEFLARIEKGDKAFAASEFLQPMRWLKDVNDDIYDPTYTDMLRVAFTAEFGRGRLADL